MKRLICIALVICALGTGFNAGAVSTSAKAAVLINADTGEVIYEQNAHQRLPMASTTKIMTGLLLCELGDMEKEITVTPQMVRVEGTSMGLLAGDKVTYNDLLYGLMLVSGNDAANAIAYSLGGTVDGFVALMNRKAKALGLKNTSFETPSGLDGEEHYTTAYDLARLTRYALDNKLFRKAVSTKSVRLCYGNPPYRRTVTNHNKMLNRFEGAIGVKTGFTKKSGRCLVSAATREGKTVIAVTLNDSNDWQDHESLLNYGLERLKITEIKPSAGSVYLPVMSGDCSGIKVQLESHKTSTLTDGDFHCRVYLPQFLYAPVAKGEAIGYAVYYKGDKEIARKEIKCYRNIKKAAPKASATDRFLECFKHIFSSIWES